MNRTVEFIDRLCVILCLVASLLIFGLSTVVATGPNFMNHRLMTLAHPSSFIRHPSIVPQRKLSSEVLQKYVGRYQLDAGIIPISTLDVSLINNELWLKPSVVKKRRLIHKSRTVFIDEIEGTQLVFNKDEDAKIVSVEFEYEGAKYTAQKIALPPPSLKGNTTFRLKGYAEAGTITLAGSFNNWNQSEYVFARQGDEWICRIDLEPGKYAYKFIVDGNWLLDPENANQEDDDYGVKNSVIIVAKGSGQNPQP